jgi:hypothetical protein
MADGIDLERKQREEARWRILRILDAGRPIGVNESVIWRGLDDVKLALSQMQVRRELTYLRDLNLVEIDGADSETWSAKLTAQGRRYRRIYHRHAARHLPPQKILVTAPQSSERASVPQPARQTRTG